MLSLTWMRDFTSSVAAFVPRLIAALLILGASWLVSIWLERSAAHLLRDRSRNRDIADLLGQALRATLLATGLLTALGTLGVDTGALIAGLGMTGFALGFAVRDALSNLLAGILLLFYEPFQRDDHITVAGHQGRVSDVNLRYTTLEAEGKTILIPNSQLFNNAVVVDKR